MEVVAKSKDVIFWQLLILILARVSKSVSLT